MQNIRQNESLKGHIHYILAGILLNGFIQGRTKKKLNNSVLYEANNEIFNSFAPPKSRKKKRYKK